MSADPLLFDPLGRPAPTMYDLRSFLDTYEPKVEHDARTVKVAKLNRKQLIEAILDLQRRMRSGEIKSNALAIPNNSTINQQVDQWTTPVVQPIVKPKRRETVATTSAAAADKPKKDGRRKTTSSTASRSASDITPSDSQSTSPSNKQATSSSTNPAPKSRSVSEHKPTSSLKRPRDPESPPPAKRPNPSIETKIDWDALNMFHPTNQGIPVITPAKPSKPNPFQSDQTPEYQKLITPTSRSTAKASDRMNDLMDIDSENDCEGDNAHFAIQAPRSSVKHTSNKPAPAPHQDDVDMIETMAREIRSRSRSKPSTNQSTNRSNKQFSTPTVASSSTQPNSQSIHPKTPEAERFSKYQSEIKQTGRLSTPTLVNELGLSDGSIIDPPVARPQQSQPSFNQSNSSSSTRPSIQSYTPLQPVRVSSNQSINQSPFQSAPFRPFEEQTVAAYSIQNGSTEISQPITQTIQQPTLQSIKPPAQEPWWCWLLPALYAIAMMLAFFLLSRHEPIKSWLVEEPLFCSSTPLTGDRTIFLNGHLLPCVPCPPHGTCSTEGKLHCDPEYVRQGNVCKPDTVFYNNAFKLKQHMLHLLREQAGRAECGYTSQSSLQGSDLQHDPSVHEMIKPWLKLDSSDSKKTAGDLEKYIGKALSLLKEDEAACQLTGSHDMYRALYEATETYRPLRCEIRMLVMDNLLELGVLLASMCWAGYAYWSVSRYFSRRRAVPQLVNRIRDRLSHSQQAIAIDHLREELWHDGDASVWQSVVKSAERDTRIQPIKVNAGHIKKDGWHWVGPVPMQ